VGQAQGVTRPEVWLARHGQTEWSRDGRHTSRTDVPLTPQGEAEGRHLARALAGVEFDLVLTSPRRRAADTAALLGHRQAEVDPDLVEWDYGDYEGLTTAAIRETVPGWRVWTHPSPGGESGEEVAARADRVVDRIVAGARARALVVSHGHFLRVLAARWLDQPAAFGMRLVLGTATLSVLGWEREARAISLWNLRVPAAETDAGPAPPSP
jgi:broad specificity phosphatase PhoE